MTFKRIGSALLQIKTYYVAYAALLVTTLIVLLFLYWEFWPQSVFKLNRDIKVITPHPVAGDYIEYEMDYCRNNNFTGINAVVQTSFIDHLLYLTPPTVGPLPSGCNTLDIVVPLPRFRAGFYKLQVERTYWINPLKREVSKSTSDVFYVYDR
jgi:hypothetical protein